MNQSDLQQQLLLQLQALQSKTTTDNDLQALAQALRVAHGPAVAAILYYGSCLRSGNASEGIADFYVVVDNYRQARMGWFRAALNRILPPNVYYLEVPPDQHQGKITLRAKYAVISARQFHHGVTGGWFLPYLWGRFAQPAGVLYARDDATRQHILTSLVQALQYFMGQILPLVPLRFTARDLWQAGLKASYATELRAEREAKIEQLFDYWQPYYEQQTELILAAENDVKRLSETSEQVKYESKIPSAKQALCRRRWLLRRCCGKLVALTKLIKSLLTFKGAVDYVAWKVERHSGQPVELPPLARRWPVIGGWLVLWKLLRSGSLR